MPRAHGLGIEGGVFHLTHRCHIKLNMVRCGVVAHPKDWEWVGYHEFLAETQPQIRSRRETQIVEEAPDLWVLRESPRACRMETGAKNAPKP